MDAFSRSERDPAPSRQAGRAAWADSSAHPSAHLSADRHVAWLLTQVRRHQHVAEQHLSLNSADLRLLWLLSDGRARTLREVAEELSLEQSTVNRQVNVALAAGLLRRYEEPGRSARLIEPSPQGRRAFEDDIATALGAYEEALQTLGDDADSLLALLERFTDAYGEAVQGLSAPPV
jgi:DNA-binding MarR family transcriptional regulator